MPAVDFILDTKFDDLPAATIHEAIRCLVDTIGVAVGGSQTKLASIIHNHAVRQFSGTDESFGKTAAKPALRAQPLPMA